MRRVTLAILLSGIAVFLLSNPARIIAYLTDLKIYQPTNYYSFIPPAAGSSYVDPVFGTTITRLSDAMRTTRADSGGTVVSISNEYSTMSPFNSNNSYILLAEFSYFALYDGATGRRIKHLCCQVNSNSEPRWSRTNPAVFYYHYGNQLKSYNVTTDVATLIHTFSEYGSISAHGESEISHDGDHLVLAGDGRYVFVYTISTDSKGGVFDTAVGGAWDSVYITPRNNVLISWMRDGYSRYQGEELYDVNMNFLRQAASYNTHKRITKDIDGSEILVQFNGNDPRPISNCNNGLVKINLATLQQACLLPNMDWSLASHVTAPDGNGWVFVEMYNPNDVNPDSSSWVTYTNEILQVKLDGTQVRRLAHHRSRPLNSYTYQPKASVSRDGTRIIYGSNYGLQAILGYPTEYSDAYMLMVPGATTSTPTATAPTISTASLPAGTQGTSYSTTLAASGGTAPYTWAISAGALPAGLALSVSTGVISGTPSADGTSSFTAKVTDSASLSSTQALSITINASTTTGGGTTSGGGTSTTTTTTVVQENNSAAVYSGGWYTVKRGYYSGNAASSAMTRGDQASFTFTGVAVRWIGYKDEWAGIANVYLDGQLQATVDTYARPSRNEVTVWSATGLTNSSHTLTIVAAGTANPSSGGTWVWVDAYSVDSVTTAPAANSPSITTASLPAGTQSSPYTTTLAAAGGTTPYSWSLASGALPTGLALATTGMISGTPSTAGTNNFTVKLIDAASQTVTKALSIIINALAPSAAPLAISTTSLPNATQNAAYGTTLAATGGTAPYTWSVASGALPAGLALAASTGIISGTPTGSGTSSFTVKVSDAAAQATTQALSLTVNALNTTPVHYEQTNSAVSYAGGWYTVSRTYYGGGSAGAAMSLGDKATLTFTGSGVSWIGYRDEWSGIANVYVDGQFKATVDTYATPSVTQNAIWSISGLPAGNHTLTITVQGTRNASSGGTWVWLDGFDVIP